MERSVFSCAYASTTRGRRRSSAKECAVSWIRRSSWLSCSCNKKGSAQSKKGARGFCFGCPIHSMTPGGNFSRTIAELLSRERPVSAGRARTCGGCGNSAAAQVRHQDLTQIYGFNRYGKEIRDTARRILLMNQGTMLRSSIFGVACVMVFASSIALAQTAQDANAASAAQAAASSARGCGAERQGKTIREENSGR